MNDILMRYAEVVGEDVIDQLQQLAASLHGRRIVHINSTKEGGGVAEILNKMIPLKTALGLDVAWEVVTGPPDFYQCTKGFHNALQGNQVGISDKLLRVYRATNEANAAKLKDVLSDADLVFIHDPQPAALIASFPNRTNKWIWRCHIDVSRPQRSVWKFLRGFVAAYDASIFSLSEFAQPLDHPQYLIAPSIDPLSEKNCPLKKKEIVEVLHRFNLKEDVPLVVQVSRFDRFKDPLGVIEAFRIARRMTPMQLVLAGGGASDDPEGAAVLEEVRTAANDDPDIHILELPPDAHRTINALQRGADIVMQKSTREGFGLTVTEGMWKGKPVIGGDTGGIRLQVIDHYTGFLVRTPEGAALRMRYLLHHRDKLKEMGWRAQRMVKENFLITRHVRDYLALMLSLLVSERERLEVWMWNQGQ